MILSLLEQIKTYELVTCQYIILNKMNQLTTETKLGSI